MVFFEYEKRYCNDYKDKKPTLENQNPFLMVVVSFDRNLIFVPLMFTWYKYHVVVKDAPWSISVEYSNGIFYSAREFHSICCPSIIRFVIGQMKLFFE